MDCFEQQAPCYSSEPVYSPRTKTDSTERPGRTPILFHTMVLHNINNFFSSEDWHHHHQCLLWSSNFSSHTQQTILQTPQTVFAESPTKKYLLLLAFTQAGQPVLEVSLVHQKPLNFGTLYEARVISQHLYVQSKADKAGRRVLQTNPTLKWASIEGNLIGHWGDDSKDPQELLVKIEGWNRGPRCVIWLLTSPTEREGLSGWTKAPKGPMWPHLW
jgi:hypothetical protein